jgi:sulfite exporter TauE/SafE
MTALILAVFLASLLGGLHCVGMCGAFLAMVVGDNRSSTVQAGYHVGRLISYVLLGAIVGALGKALDLAGAMAGIAPLALTLSAVAIALIGVLNWLRLRGTHMPGIAGPTWLKNATAKGYRAAMKFRPLQRATIIGLLTTLLPCGWLWTFLLTAGGTASPLLAAITMAVFWLGTLPAMIAAGVGLRGLLGIAQCKAPALTCLVMIFAGLFTLAGRAHLNPRAWSAVASDASHATPACCEVNHDNHH